MRHAPYKVNPDARDRWLLHMRDAVDSLDLAPLHRAELGTTSSGPPTDAQHLRGLMTMPTR